MRTRRQPVVLFLLVGFLLGVSAAPASEVRRVVPRDESTTAVHSAMDLLRHLENLLASFWSKNGCQIDPWGACVKDTGGSGSPESSGEASSSNSHLGVKSTP
jgi:hypothetical protein